MLFTVLSHPNPVIFRQKEHLFKPGGFIFKSGGETATDKGCEGVGDEAEGNSLNTGHSGIHHAAANL
jgi:hypothetical protein